MGVWLLGCQDIYHPSQIGPVNCGQLCCQHLPSLDLAGYRELHSCPQGYSALCFKLIPMKPLLSGYFHFWGTAWKLRLLSSLGLRNPTLPLAWLLGLWGGRQSHFFLQSWVFIESCLSVGPLSCSRPLDKNSSVSSLRGRRSQETLAGRCGGDTGRIGSLMEQVTTVGDQSSSPGGNSGSWCTRLRVDLWRERDLGYISTCL